MQAEWGEHAQTLLKYFVAEGLACRQQLLHLHDGSSSNGVLSSLPKVMDAVKGVAEGEEASGSGSQDAGDKAELKIAWQYKRCAAI
jgi:PAXNEB protein